MVVIKSFFSFTESALCASRKMWLVAQGISDTGVINARVRLIITVIDLLSGAVGLFFVLDAPWTAVIIGGAIIAADLIPRNIALRVPEKIVSRLLPFIKNLNWGNKPVYTVPSDSQTDLAHDELRYVLLEGEKSGVVEQKERTMVEGVFYLGDRKTATFMVHRSEIHWLELTASAEESKRIALEHYKQRYFPVAKGSLDAVVGIVSVHDILVSLLEGTWQGLSALIQTPCFVPQTMSALKAFEAFKHGDADFLVVMDEYGGFAGTLSVYNLVEAIVGELSTTPTESLVKQEDGSFLADGMLNIDDLADALNIDMPEHRGYHTVAGFILELSGEIPKTGAFFYYGQYRWTIVDMDGNRIDKLLITPIKE
jgi:putative hemolysin